jgi:AsmA protein
VKKLLIGLATVIVLVIIAAIAVPRFIPLDTYKARLIAAVKDETGRDLRIDGPVHFSLLPSVALEANDVSLSNPPGAISPNMVQLKTLDVELKLLPLLHGAVEVTEFKLVQPAIALEIDKQGKPSWAFTPAAAPAAATQSPTAAPPPQASATSSGASGFSAISLGDVSIVDGQASYLDQRTGQKRLLSNINMSLSLADPSKPFSAKGSAVWDGVTATLTAQVGKPGTLQSGGTSPVAITFAASPINFAFKGSATGVTLDKLTGGIDLSIPSVRNLAKWVGVPFDAPGTGFGQMTLSGQLDKQGPKLAFSNAVITLDAIKGTGALTVDSSGAKPVLGGRLDVDKLDVNPYLASGSGSASASPGAGTSAPAATGGGAGGGAASASGGAAPATPAPGAAKSGAWSDAPLDLAPLKLADAELALSANAIVYHKINIGRSVLALHLKDGKFEAELSQMALYQGKGEGKVTADGSGAVPGLAATFNLSGIAVQPLLRDAAGFDKLSGTGSLTIDVAGHGKSQREIVGSLGGKGNLDLANGKIEGVDLIAITKNAASALAGGKGGGNETTFGALTGSYTITNGILKNNDLKLTSPEIPMSGAGTVDLPLQQVNYRLTPTVAGLAVPVDVTGPWDNLSYRPDLAGIATGIAQDPNKFLKNLKSGGGGAGASSLLKGLLGK